jgi:uncharacterized C2H2 Zn-finger protein
MNSFIYLIQDGKYANTTIYTVGKMTQKCRIVMNVKPFELFSKYSVIQYLRHVDVQYVDSIEHEILQVFKNTFTLMEGNHTFQGDLCEMIKLVDKIINNLSVYLKMKTFWEQPVKHIPFIPPTAVGTAIVPSPVVVNNAPEPSTSVPNGEKKENVETTTALSAEESLKLSANKKPILSCSHCQMVFKNKTEYLRHTTKKTKCYEQKRYNKITVGGSVNIQCNSCQQVFSQISNFYKHYKDHHKEDEELIEKVLSNEEEQVDA